MLRVEKELKGKFIRLAEYFPKLKKIASSQVLIPIQSNLTATLPPGGKIISEDHLAFPRATATILEFDDRASVMNSKERPLKIKMRGDDGNSYSFLCKKEESGDMRKNSRLMEFCTVVNRLLRNTAEARKRNLRLRTFAVLPMTEECGIIEWVNNTTCFRTEVEALQRDSGHPYSYQEVRKILKKYDKDKILQYRALKEKFPAVFHLWFVKKFTEPTKWFENRLHFIRSVATWSMVGYIVGLGDRHGENILLDNSNGECVHVDFDCLFDRGRQLSVPERVPFRLTPNIVAGFGVTGCAGTFQKSCENTLLVLRKNRDTLMNVLYSFVHDPLVEWKKKGDSSEISELKASEIMRRIESRLRGQLGEDKMELPLSVPGQVHQLIEDATSEENLSRMYVGWMPWM